mgnify:CR=1 FL=1
MSALEAQIAASGEAPLTTALDFTLPASSTAIVDRKQHCRAYPTSASTLTYNGTRTVRIRLGGDDFVDPAFGTGAVKVTPAHDPNDREVGLRHNLPAPTILDEAARIVADSPTPFAGMDRFAARSAIVAALDDRGLLVSSRPHASNPARYQRSNDILEPRLRTQWFIKAKPLAEKAIADALSRR